MPADLHVVAFPNVGTSHANAQTFARAMALNMLGAQLGRADLRANAAELIDWQVARPEVWKWGNDFLNTHWIAQMGILAMTAPAGPGARVVAPSDPVDPTDPTGADRPGSLPPIRPIPGCRGCPGSRVRRCRQACSRDAAPVNLRTNLCRCDRGPSPPLR